MTDGIDSAMAQPSDEPFDLAVAGAGIFGLSVAHAAIKAGLRVAVLEKDRVGAGSSGGLLGALMPHMPARWNPKGVPVSGPAEPRRPYPPTGGRDRP
ncbi:FAD-dependent oxidoreductase [Roseibium salinum]|uniref:FAD-dependent oxidoreductase n=1 Tax=Roseibium salinum TaxID=1604349 RepID=UPI00361D56C0